MLDSKVQAFLDHLPTALDNVEWSRDLQARLMTLFDGDVDHVVVNARVSPDLLMPHLIEERDNLIVRDSVTPTSTRDQVRVQQAKRISTERWRDVYETGAKGSGFPHHRYQYPVGVDLYTENLYAGSILLFRLLERPPISEETIALLNQLRGVLAFLICDHSARQLVEYPSDAAWPRLVELIQRDVKLTPREAEVLALLFTGHSYDEAARVLSVSYQTINSHASSIYRKTGANNVKDLFNLYANPRRDVLKLPS